MHVVLADPPAFTPPYDHELAAALARTGARVELVTSPFRFGERPAAAGYALVESFYPRSSRIGGRSRLALKAVEHPAEMLRLMRRPADVLHLPWLAAPEVDVTSSTRVPDRASAAASSWSYGGVKAGGSARTTCIGAGRRRYP